MLLNTRKRNPRFIFNRELSANRPSNNWAEVKLLKFLKRPKHQISPNNTNTQSREWVMRINKMIT